MAERVYLVIVFAILILALFSNNVSAFIFFKIYFALLKLLWEWGKFYFSILTLNFSLTLICAALWSVALLFISRNMRALLLQATILGSFCYFMVHNAWIAPSLHNEKFGIIDNEAERQGEYNHKPYFESATMQSTPAEPEISLLDAPLPECDIQARPDSPQEALNRRINCLLYRLRCHHGVPEKHGVNESAAQIFFYNDNTPEGERTIARLLPRLEQAISEQRICNK